MAKDNKENLNEEEYLYFKHKYLKKPGVESVRYVDQGGEKIIIEVSSNDLFKGDIPEQLGGVSVRIHQI